jgi:hypothetical protein
MTQLMSDSWDGSMVVGWISNRKAHTRYGILKLLRGVKSRVKACAYRICNEQKQGRDSRCLDELQEICAREGFAFK